MKCLYWVCCVYSYFVVVVINEQDATAARVRVLIRSQDYKESWWTIGVSENIIEASKIALLDSIEFKLMKDKKKKTVRKKVNKKRLKKTVRKKAKRSRTSVHG